MKISKKQWLTLQLHVPKRFQEGTSNFLMEKGAAGLEETDGEEGEILLRAYFPGEKKEKPIRDSLSRYLRSLQRAFQEDFRSQIDTAFVGEQDWGKTWKKHFKPVRVGSRFIIFPPWEKIKPVRGQVPIEINPGMAFGTGTHATTQLCLRVLERTVKRGISALDVGTGSGILAIAAAKLGARVVWGLDVDPVAIKAARENIAQNGAIAVVRVRKGGVGRLSGQFDLIVANIDFKSLMRLAHPLMDHLQTGGILVLSGLLAEQEERIRQAYLRTGILRQIDTVGQDEWVCMTFRRRKNAG